MLRKLSAVQMYLLIMRVFIFVICLISLSICIYSSSNAYADINTDTNTDTHAFSEKKVLANDDLEGKDENLVEDSAQDDWANREDAEECLTSYITTRSVGDNLQKSGKNEWQIVAEQYQGNDAFSKTISSDDGSVRIQKNVIPTNTENEFIVYLSMDKKMSWKKFLDECGFKITTSNKYHKYPIGTVIYNVVGNSSEILPHNEQGGYTNKYYTKFEIYESKGSPVLYTYYDWRYGTTPNCSNATGFFTLPNGANVIASQSVNLHNGQGGQGNPLEFKIYLDQFQEEIDLVLFNIVFDTVNDGMGDNILFEGFVAGDTTNASFNNETKTITWNPSNETLDPTIEESPITGWYENVAELAYKVRLDVTPDNFNSCANNMNSVIGDNESYAVNNAATLDYHKEALEGGPAQSGDPNSVDFQNPYVRGLQYSTALIKKGRTQNGTIYNDLEGAEFGIYLQGQTEGEPLSKAISDSNGKVYFTNLPCGSYVLKEIQPPPGYIADPDSQSYSEVDLCYTNDTNNLEQDSANKNLFINSDWSTRKVSNVKVQVALQINKVIEGSEAPLEGVKFSIYKDDGDGEYSAENDIEKAVVFDSVDCDNLYTQPVETDADGQVTCCGLDINVKYWIVEEATVAGYQLLEKPISVTFISADEAIFFDSHHKKFDYYICPVTITNKPIPDLPVAGSSDLAILTIFGLFLIMTGLILLITENGSIKNQS